MSRTRATLALKFAHHLDSEKLNALEVFTSDHDVITGAPISSEATIRGLRVLAHEAGYTFFIRDSGWVSVKRTLVQDRNYNAGVETYIDNETEVKTQATFATITIERFGRIVFLTSPDNIKEEALNEWFEEPSPAIYSHKLEEDRVVEYHGANVRVKSGQPGDDVFVVEFALKLQPIKK